MQFAEGLLQGLLLSQLQERDFAAVCAAPTSQAPSTTHKAPAATEGNRLNPPAWGLRLWFLMVSVLPAWEDQGYAELLPFPLSISASSHASLWYYHYLF